MKSKYDGFCVNCKKKWKKGDEIKNESGKWVHETCPSSFSLSNPPLSGRNVPVMVQEEGSNTNFNTEWAPSIYQQDIFTFIKEGTGNGVVEAVAGSGKTTTIVRALNLIPLTSKVLFLAFNKHIAKELKNKAPENVRVSTLHAMGLSIIKKLADFKDVDDDKPGWLMDDYWAIDKEHVKDEGDRIRNRMKRNQMRKIISLAKATLIDVNSIEEVTGMMEKYGIDMDDQTPEVISRLPDLMERCVKHFETIDFDDMVWLPLVHPRLQNHFDKYDYVFIDEAQDLNKCNMEFVLKLVSDNGRIIAVGDRKQSLYGFRGANTEAIPDLINILEAKVLPLSISYRCPKLHVEMAKEIVPQIQASENAVEGKFGYIEYKDFLKEIQPGDMVLCRTNAPLVKPAFEAIRQGKKAMIRGKDIGKSLVNFVERFQTESLPQLEILMSEYTEIEYNRLLDKGKELQADLVVDKTNTIRQVANECRNVQELLQKLEMLFSDTNIGIVFSSVHRSKGLEAEKVYVLHRELMPHPKAKQLWELVQEDNTLYVALTRSKNEMYFVKEEQK